MKFFDSKELRQSADVSRWACRVLPAVLAVLLYAVTLGGNYVYDDKQMVCADTRMHHANEWVQLWTRAYSPGAIDNLYRPIVSSSYALEWYLHGDRPWIFHGINILLHALASVLVAEFTRRALERTTIANNAALCAGLLFAAHPVHVEAVANIVGRAESLCTAGIFGAMILLCRRPLTLPRVISIVAIGIFAMLCKEHGILQPLLWFFVWLTVWPVLKIEIFEVARERQALTILLLLTTWIWAAYLIVREHFLRFEWDLATMDATYQPLVLSHGPDRVLMPIVLLGRYTALLLWPIHLSPDYGADVIGSVAHFSDPYLWIGLLLLTLWIAAIVACGSFFLTRRHGDTEKRNDLSPLSSPCLRVPVLSGFILFCLLAFAVTYGLIGNAVTLIATNFGERLLYLPSAFFLMIVGTLIARLPFKPRAITLAILLSLSSIRTVTAAREWNHPLILFQHALANQPKSIQLHLLLASEYHALGNLHAAQSLLHEATDLYPNYWRVWLFRAKEDMDDGNLTDAEQSLNRAKDLNADPRLIGEFSRLADLKAKSLEPQMHTDAPR